MLFIYVLLAHAKYIVSVLWYMTSPSMVGSLGKRILENGVVLSALTFYPMRNTGMVLEKECCKSQYFNIFAVIHLLFYDCPDHPYTPGNKFKSYRWAAGKVPEEVKTFLGDFWHTKGAPIYVIKDNKTQRGDLRIIKEEEET